MCIGNPLRFVFSLWVLLAITTSAQAWLTIDFEDPVLAAETALPATAEDQDAYISHGVVFNRGWSTEFDCCPSGWAVSNQTDQTTAGPSAAFSAVSLAAGGGGRESSQFAVANNFQQGESRIVFPTAAAIQGMYVTNTTYTYQAVVNGDDGAGFVKGPFVAGDWLRLDVIGLDASANETGRGTLFLADYRDGLTTALDAWTWLDLADLGSAVHSLEFVMESTDSSPFGMNTPAYFAIDDLTYQLVPEPAGSCHLALALLTVVGLSTKKRRR